MLLFFDCLSKKDWVLGYFINYYNISAHVTESFYKDVPQARIESYSVNPLKIEA